MNQKKDGSFPEINLKGEFSPQYSNFLRHTVPAQLHIAAYLVSLPNNAVRTLSFMLNEYAARLGWDEGRAHNDP